MQYSSFPLKIREKVEIRGDVLKSTSFHFWSGALHCKMFIIENNKIDAYLRSGYVNYRLALPAGLVKELG